MKKALLFFLLAAFAAVSACNALADGAPAASYLGLRHPVTKFTLPDDPSAFSPDLAYGLLAAASCYSADSASRYMLNAGFDIVLRRGYDKAPDDASHTCAWTIGKKQMEVRGQERTVLLITIRGTDGAEWISNMDISPSRDSETRFAGNFLACAGDAFFGLMEASRGIENPVYVVTGYSRGAAAANLTARLLNASVPAQDVYAYAFACPLTLRGESDGTYEGNIFNVVDPCDPVTHLPPEGWGFRRAGTDVALDIPDGADGELRRAFDALVGVVPDISAYYGTRFLLGAAGTGDTGVTPFELMTALAYGLSGSPMPAPAGGESPFGQWAAKDAGTPGAGGAAFPGISPESSLYPLLGLFADSGPSSLAQAASRHIPASYEAHMDETFAPAQEP